MTVSQDNLSEKSRLGALLWALLGLHRFYAGLIGTGVLFLITLGGLGIWWLIVVITIIVGIFKDGAGKIINTWSTEPKHIAPPAIILGIVIFGGIIAGGGLKGELHQQPH